MVHVTVMDGDTEIPPERQPSRERRLVAEVFRSAEPEAQICYQRALKTDPYLYGEVVVRFVLGPEGEVADANAVMDTLGDPQLVACVEDLVASLEFPLQDSGIRGGRYPFLFVSDLTPPEVVRALRVQYGMALPEDSNDREPGALDQQPEFGTVEVW